MIKRAIIAAAVAGLSGSAAMAAYTDGANPVAQSNNYVQVASHHEKGCNPCAAKGCNPCAAKGCNPCAAKGCNPCAAKKGCNPCAAENPCAAKKGCHPCKAE